MDFVERINDGDLPPHKILFVSKTAVNRKQNVKASGFGSGEQFAVLESAKAGVSRRLAFMAK